LLRNGALAQALWRLQITLVALWSPTVMGVTGIVIGTDGRVLLVRHSYRAGWMLPGGGVGRGEPPQAAIQRELAEEVGLQGGEPEFIGLFTRRAGWASNVIALYRVTGGVMNFRPNLEIRDILWADPAAPPPGASRGTLRRLAELQGGPISPYW
jgi:8-oxo-dGTP pyrophosphatase MutT (NUDIX family)